MNKYLVAILATITIHVSAIPLSSAYSDEIYISTKNACIKKQTNAPENANFTAGQIAIFCSCVANQTVNFLSDEEASHMQKTDDFVPMLNATMAAYKWCANP